MRIERKETEQTNAKFNSLLEKLKKWNKSMRIERKEKEQTG